jgi:hypothetical protein
LWISQAYSQLATSVSSLAYPLLLLGTTGSAVVAGLAASGARPWRIRSRNRLHVRDQHRRGFVGALLTPALQRRFRPAAIFRAAAVIDCGATLAILPLDSPYLIGAAGAAAFFLAPAVTASLFGTLSLHCPDELAGRAQASLGLIVGAAAPIAPVAIGLVLDRWGATTGITVLACVFASLAIAAFVIPAFRPTLDS